MPAGELHRQHFGLPRLPARDVDAVEVLHPEGRDGDAAVAGDRESVEERHGASVDRDSGAFEGGQHPGPVVVAGNPVARARRHPGGEVLVDEAPLEGEQVPAAFERVGQEVAAEHDSVRLEGEKLLIGFLVAVQVGGVDDRGHATILTIPVTPAGRVLYSWQP